MANYIAGRLIHALIVLVLASLIAFLFLHLSGDPVALILGDFTSREEILRLRKELGLDQPIYVQYWVWFQKALRGDLGESIRYRLPATELIIERLPATALLSLTAMTIAVSVGSALGLLGAVFRDTLIDHIVQLVAILGQSIPFFWLALMSMMLFSVYLGWLPTSGYGTWRHLILPAVALSTLPAARIVRLLRSSLIDVLSEDYIRTARGKGLAPLPVVFGHALKNAAIPVVTVVALQLGTAFGGSIITETVFSWPGVGRLSIDAANSRDYPLFQGIVLLMAVVFVSLNLLTDLLYALLDPRIRYS